MIDKKENNRSAIQDFSQPRNSAFSLPTKEKRTVSKGSNNNCIYMIFGILGFVVVAVLIYLSISYLLSIKTMGHLLTSVTVLTTILVITVIVIRTAYPRRPPRKDVNDED